ncbi:MAG: hydroxyacid dehydrogenase [Rhodospirillaceae bacterium]|jgi:D-3-phosphoglycerate dehydrogenase|nr:hydroxyacid dehydrogenase [Rhodospirillaceae bacterium]MBT5664342.1 hydroxyacid dehydrogenase [Rhodospirillaceae bacterium]MBT5811716.1 hydroxyacid dehydrogenase [Rhodospirillaceae bacterium]
MPSPKPWVAVTATDDFPVSMTPVRAALRGVAPIKTIPLPFSPIGEAEEFRFAKMLKGAAGMLLRPGYITPTLLDKLPDLRVVAVHGAGVDQVDVAACTERGVLVTNAPGANADAVAELTLCLMVNLARKVAESAARVQAERVWGEARHTGTELKGKTLGLVGIGQIGGRVTGMAKAFGMKVCAHDPGLSTTDIRALGARPMTLDALLGASDYVSLHAPHIPATHHMINRKAFGAMKKGAFLINAARGPLVDEAALARALKSGKLGGAALDVLEGEPPDPDSPIFDAPNILLTPHIGGSTVECLDAIAGTAGADIARFLQGKRVRHPVNKVRKTR